MSIPLCPGVLRRACAFVSSLLAAVALFGAPPTITTQPAVVTAESGNDATFTVAATGSGPLTYQWRRLGTNLAGGTGSSLTLPAVKMADAGLYDVVVTDGAEATTSRAGRLDVVPATIANTLRLDTTFTPLFEQTGAWVTGGVRTPAGDLILSGNYSTIGGVRRHSLARFNSALVADPTFAPVLNSHANLVALQPDGRILIAGEFSEVNGVSRNRIARLNADGSLDPTFDPGAGISSDVATMVLQPDGKVIVGGYFSTVAGISRGAIARFNADGSLDSAFATGSGATGSVSGIALRPDGKVVIAGWFSSFNGVARNAIAQLQADGSLDASFNPGAGFDGSVNKCVLLPDGDVLAGGSFNKFNNVAVNQVVRLNPDGTRDAAFSPPGTLQSVDDLAILENGNIAVVGGFAPSASAPQRRITILNASGLPHPGFAPTATPDNSAYLVIPLPGSGMVVAGAFDAFGGQSCGGPVVLDAAGAVTTMSAPGFRALADVECVVPVANGRWLVGGPFGFVNGSASVGVARLNADGSRDATFASPFSGTGQIRELLVQGDGRIVVLGSIYPTGAPTPCVVARLLPNGPLDNSFDHTVTFDMFPDTGAVQADGRLLLGATFENPYNGTSAHIARLNRDGTRDSSLVVGTGFAGPVQAIVPTPDGRILVSGGFSSFNGTSRGHVARLESNGTLDPGFASGVGISGTYLPWLQLRADGKVMIAGLFEFVDGVAALRAARLTATGANDASFVANSGFDDRTGATLGLADGRTLYCGAFTKYAGVARRSLAALQTNGALDPSFEAFDLRYQPRGVTGMCYADDGRLLLWTARAIRGATVQSGLVLLKSDVSPIAAITTQPVSQSTTLGASATFSVTATGDDLTYQWLKNGVNIAGATNATLVLSNVQSTDLGNYTVRVSNRYGSVVSSAVPLAATSTAIVTPPGVVVGRSGESVTLSVGASGWGSLAYQWYRLGVAIPGATAATLTLNNLHVGDQGRYDVVVSSPFDSVEATPGWIVFQAAPSTFVTTATQVPEYLERSLPGRVSDHAARVFAGNDTTHVLGTDGALRAAGNNSSSQLGTAGGPGNVLAYSLIGVASVSSGSGHTLFLKNDGTLWGVGANYQGQLPGLPGFVVTTPGKLADGVLAAEAGTGFTLFVTTDRRLWGVGDNFQGQLGDNSTTTRYVPVEVSTGVRAVAAGSNHSLFLRTDGSLWAMGDNSYGQLGDGTTVRRLRPVKVAENVAAIAAGRTSSYFIRTDGTLWACGDNSVGQLGDGLLMPRYLPVAIDADVTGVSSFDHSAAYVTADGTAWTMGANGFGQLGDGTRLNRSTPVAIATDAAEVAMGARHLVLRLADGQVLTTGDDRSGELARGLSRPELVLRESGVVAAGCNAADSTTLDAAGTLRWGGHNDPTTSVPNVIAFGGASGFGRRTVLKSDRSLWTVSNGGASSPLATDVVAFSATEYYVVFLKRDGTLWGKGNSGTVQFGDGSSPVLVASGVASVSAATNHLLFVKRDRTLWGMGRTTDGFVEGEVWGQFSSTPVQLQTGIVSATAAPSQNFYCKSDGSAWRRGAGWTVAAGAEFQLDTGVIAVASSGYYLKSDSTLCQRPVGGSPVAVSVGVLNVCSDTVDRLGFLLADGAGSAPILDQQPANQTVVAGSLAEFQVTAHGTAVLHYQWQHDGIPVPLQNSNVLRLPCVRSEDAGAYAVVVTSGGVSVTSNAVQLTVLTAPEFADSPTDVIVAAGDPVNLAVGTAGTGPISFRWRRDGVVIPGETSAAFAIPAASQADSAVYALDAFNSVDLRRTEGTILTVTDAATQLSVDRFQDGTLGSEWNVPWSSFLQFNGTSFVESLGRVHFVADTPTSPVDRVLLHDGGLVLNQSWTVTLRLGLAPNSAFPDLNSPTSDRKAGFALGVGSSLDADDNFDIAFRLSTYSGSLQREIVSTLEDSGARSSGALTAPAEATSLVVRLAYDAGTGELRALALVGGEFQLVKSFQPQSAWGLAPTDTLEVGLRGFSSRLNVLEGQVWADDFVQVARGGPMITQQPSSLLVPMGGNATFTVAASGAGLTYQWYRNGLALPGATAPTLTLTPVGAADFGRYLVVVSDGTGGSASSIALLEEANAPVIVSLPGTAPIPFGTSTTLTVGVTGTAPMSFQWYRGDSGDTANPIAGATSASYVTPALNAWTRYWLRASNAFGAVDTPTLLVRVTGGSMRFADWIAQSNLPVDQRGPQAAPAGDGVPNLVKFRLGLAPLDDATSRLPVLRLIETAGQPTALGLEVTMDEHAHGVSFGIQTSTDLVTWNTPPQAIDILAMNASGITTLRLRESAPPAGGKRFVRFFVTLHP